MTIPKSLIALAVSVGLFYAIRGKSHILVQQSRIAMFKVLKSSQSSNWGKAWIPPEQKPKHTNN